jgi:hypothetical protein
MRRSWNDVLRQRGAEADQKAHNQQEADTIRQPTQR